MQTPLISPTAGIDRRSQAASRWRAGGLIVLRIAAAVLGGYALTWGFCAAGMVALVACGMDFHEAEHGVMLLAFIVFLVAFLWAFASQSLLRVWLWLVGSAALLTLLAEYGQRSLVG